jgi:hypothetical protein
MPDKIIFMTNSIAENYLAALKQTLKNKSTQWAYPRGPIY